MTKCARILAVFNHPGGMRAILPVLDGLKEFDSFILIVTSESNRSRLVECVFPVIFINKHFSISSAENILKKERVSCLISGTSEPDNSDTGRIESTFISASKRLGVSSVSILDCWHKYRERYSLSTTSALDAVPDRICVMDSKAKTDMVDLGFDSLSLHVTGNPYHDKLAADARISDPIGLFQDTSAVVILFISQPLSERDYSWLEYSEFSVLQDLIKVALKVKISSNRCVNLKIKLHPSECKNKYDSVVEEFQDLDITVIEGDSDNIYDCASSSVVVGMFSMLLFELFQLGLGVIYYQPVKNKNSLIYTGNNKNPIRDIRGLYGEILNYEYARNPKARYKSMATQKVISLIKEL